MAFLFTTNSPGVNIAGTVSVPLGENTDPPVASAKPTGFCGVAAGTCCIPTCVPPRLLISVSNLFMFALAASAETPKSPVPRFNSFMLSNALFMVSEDIEPLAKLLDTPISFSFPPRSLVCFSSFFCNLSSDFAPTLFLASCSIFSSLAGPELLDWAIFSAISSICGPLYPASFREFLISVRFDTFPCAFLSILVSIFSPLTLFKSCLSIFVFAKSWTFPLFWLKRSKSSFVLIPTSDNGFAFFWTSSIFVSFCCSLFFSTDFSFFVSSWVNFSRLL